MKIQCLWVALILFLALVADTRAQSALGRVVITDPSRSIAPVDLYIAQELGFFRQEAILAEVLQVRANIGVATLLSAAAQTINHVGTLIRAMGRSDIAAKVFSHSLKKSYFWLVTKPQNNNVTELKGKIRGTATLGGSPQRGGPEPG